MIPEGSVRGLEELKIEGRAETIQTTDFVKIGWNSEKSPGDLGRLALSSERPSAYSRMKNSQGVL